jgi:hypothetical protein
MKKNTFLKSQFFTFRFSLFAFRSPESGQALISLLFFAIVAITVTSSAIVITASNSLAADKIQEGIDVYSVAEAGAEEGLMRYLRNPNFTGPETLQVDGGTATITLSGTNPTVVHSIGVAGNFKRTLDVGTTFVNGQLSIVYWKEL